MEQNKNPRFNFLDKNNYHGIRIAVNNSRSCPKIRVNRKERFIEFNYNFMYKLKESQQVFLFEWARASIKSNDIHWCDKKALERSVKLGYSQDEILEIFITVRFQSAAIQKKRLWYLVTEDPYEYKFKQALKRIKFFINPMLWIRRKK
jgi:hypothetical protein